MDVAQQSGHVFQPPMGPPPNSLADKSAILQQQSVIQSNQQLQQSYGESKTNNLPISGFEVGIISSF